MTDFDAIYTSPFSDDEVEKVRGEWRTYPERYTYAAGRWVATVDRVRAEATAAAEQRLRGLSDLVATAIVGLPDSGGVTWNEARAIGDRLLALLETPPPASPRQGEPVEGLDVAWREAESALPKGWIGPSLVTDSQVGEHGITTGWRAFAWDYANPHRKPPEGSGPTPEAALRALAAALSEPAKS